MFSLIPIYLLWERCPRKRQWAINRLFSATLMNHIPSWALESWQFTHQITSWETLGQQNSWIRCMNGEDPMQKHYFSSIFHISTRKPSQTSCQPPFRRETRGLRKNDFNKVNDWCPFEDHSHFPFLTPKNPPPTPCCQARRLCQTAWEAHRPLKPPLFRRSQKPGFWMVSGDENPWVFPIGLGYSWLVDAANILNFGKSLRCHYVFPSCLALSVVSWARNQLGKAALDLWTV